MRRTSSRIAQLRKHLDRVKWRDKEAEQTYWTLVEAQPRTRYVLSPFDPILKAYYNEDRLAEMAYRENPFFAMLKKEVGASLKDAGRKLNRTVYVIPTEHCPPDRMYMISDNSVAMANGISAWVPEGDATKSATFKTEEDMPYIEDKVVREIPQKITTNPPSDAYREGWERMFGEKKDEPFSQECVGINRPCPHPDCKAEGHEINEVDWDRCLFHCTNSITHKFMKECGCEGATVRICPYRSDVNNDADTECKCCDACEHSCAMDI